METNWAHIRDLFAYDSWANERLMDTMQELPPDEIRRDRGTSHGSLLETLSHLIGAGDVWLGRWKKGPPRSLPPAGQFQSLDALREKWLEVKNERDAFLEDFSAPRLHHELTVTTSTGERFTHTFVEMFHHLMNHSTYHRGQLAAMLRQSGTAPKATDLILFYRQRRAGV